MMHQFNLITEPLVRVVPSDGPQLTATLPDLYAALMADRVIAFPALRPHQRHAWHAFLVQIGAMALHRAGFAEPPDEAEAWQTLLRGLTPEFPDDEPWSLVAPPDKPALLQPAVPEGTLSVLNKAYETPDKIDMLVTSRNHDVKVSRMAQVEPEDWLFALIQIQTCEGFLGAGNYGISRMNGGFANRPGIGIAPPGGYGRRVQRDMRLLIEMRPQFVRTYGYPAEGGLGLLWLKPWDGAGSLRLDELDPFYVEICRRMRLMSENGRLAARSVGTKVARISMSKDLNGITGDPWTPIDVNDGKQAKVLTIDKRGFHYRRLARIMFQNGYRPAPLQEIAGTDEREGLTLVCRALVRGQGKTEGWHERVLPISAKGAGLLRRGSTDRLAALASERVDLAANLSRLVLRYALMVLFQNGPDRDSFKPRDRGSAERTEPFLARFDAEIDRTFFDDFWLEAEHIDEPERAAYARREWLLRLRERARSILRSAETGSPISSIRHYRARARAEAAFDGAFARLSPDTRERADAA